MKKPYEAHRTLLGIPVPPQGSKAAEALIQRLEKANNPGAKRPEPSGTIKSLLDSLNQYKSAWAKVTATFHGTQPGEYSLDPGSHRGGPPRHPHNFTHASSMRPHLPTERPLVDPDIEKHMVELARSAEPGAGIDATPWQLAALNYAKSTVDHIHQALAEHRAAQEAAESIGLDPAGLDPANRPTPAETSIRTIRDLVEDAHEGLQTSQYQRDLDLLIHFKKKMQLEFGTPGWTNQFGSGIREGDAITPVDLHNLNKIKATGRNSHLRGAVILDFDRITEHVMAEVQRTLAHWARNRAFG